MTEPRQQRLQYARGVADQPGFHRIAQADALGIDIDLDRFGLAWLRIELDVRKRAARNQQRVAALDRFLRRFGAEQPDAAGAIRAIVRHGTFAQERFDDRRTEPLGHCNQLRRSADCPLAGQYRCLLSTVEYLDRARELLFARHAARIGHEIGHVIGDIAFGADVFGDRLRLHVHRHRDVRDAAIGKRGAACQLHHVLDVVRSHHARVIYAHVHEQPIEIHILLGERVDQIVKLQTRDCEDRLPVELGVIEAVEQMNAARTGGGEANAELAGPFGITARVEGSRLFVADLNKANLILPGSQRLDDAVDAVSGNAEDRVHAPIDQRVD